MTEPDDIDLGTDGAARRTWLLTEAVAAVDGFGEAARLAVALEAWIENGGAFDIGGLDIDAQAPRLAPPEAETPAPRALPKPRSKQKPKSRVQEVADQEDYDGLLRLLSNAQRHSSWHKQEI